MKRILALVLVIVLAFTSAPALAFSSSGVTDPAEKYVPETAPYEDSAIQMWFEHSNVKVYQEDTASTGLSTYSVYMAKNEMQGTQVILYSPLENKSGLTASVSDFILSGGNATLDAQLYYEFYVKTEGLFTEDVYGLKDGEQSIIRNGMVPDAIAPIECINAKTGKFGLTAGKTQALYIKLTSKPDTPSGWYQGTFELKNSSGQVVKTAKVFAYVWNFEIPEETTYQTSIFIDASEGEETYKYYYDYLLENRLLGMQVPGELNSSNEYLSNPRVSAFRIANKGSYLGSLSQTEIASVYSDLSSMSNWEKIKDKAYFYAVDEPLSQELSDTDGGVRPTVNTAINSYKSISSVWPDPQTVVPHCENHPYPYYHYNTELAANGDGTYAVQYDGRAAFNGIKDSTQGMFDADCVTVWCPIMCAFTPRSVLEASGWTKSTGDCTLSHVRNLDGTISGFNIFNVNTRFFDWDTKFGTFADRFKSYQADRAAKGKNIKLWWYAAGNNFNYTYANHIIENTGLQTEIMFWQSMQVGATGYLYYGANHWNEHLGTDNLIEGSDRDYDGSTSKIWQVNKYNRNGHDIFGNGVLFYGKDVRSQLRIAGVKVIGTVRVEQMRDGIEDYEMLNLYRGIYGEEAMQSLISKVSTNVACYLSLPLFDRSAYSDKLRDEDIFAAVRKELGNAVETGKGDCIDHVWDEGVVTKEPTSTEEGEILYTCTVCGTTKTEIIKMLFPGDINDDGRLNIRDMLLLRVYVAGGETTASFSEQNADVNFDGRVNSRDLVALKNLISG